MSKETRTPQVIDVKVVKIRIILAVLTFASIVGAFIAGFHTCQRYEQNIESQARAMATELGSTKIETPKEEIKK
jgi:hypothetical protein